MPFRLLPALSAVLLRVIVIAVTCVSVTHAQQERRVALVIGNAAYKQGPLTNPINDARAMAKRLRSLGFDIVLRENLKAREIGGVYREFRSKITPGSVALVFYAGHGVQFKGQNYFPAVDADINSEEDVPLQSLNLGNLLDNMEEAKSGVSLVFLDACRDNPFARRFRAATRGLAKVEAASGMLIHYATRPGSVASDGDGQNGTYTEALLAQMSEPGVPVEQMLKRVANQVVAKTKGKQEPWVEGSLRGDFYFIFQGPTTLKVQQTLTDPEAETWAAAQGVNSVAGYQTYLDAYPNGRYAYAAKIKLTDLKKPSVSQPENAPVGNTPTPTQVAAPIKSDAMEVVVREAWVRASTPGQKATGAFMQLTATQDLRLIGARSSAAGVIEIHEMILDKDVMKMRPLPFGLDLPAGKNVELNPGGYHIMLMDLKEQLKEGDTMQLTLIVEGKDKKRSNIELRAPIKLLATKK